VDIARAPVAEALADPLFAPLAVSTEPTDALVVLLPLCPTAPATPVVEASSPVLDTLLELPMLLLELVFSPAVAALVRALGSGLLVSLVCATLMPSPLAGPLVAVAVSVFVD
jgi:hypothetical protein